MACILVIEDDLQVREFLTEILTREGHLVTEAADGRQGIHAFRNNPIDLIITDLFMPVKEGLETIIDLRKEHPDLKIIAISGGTPDGKGDYLRAAQLCGAQHIFQKPFDKDTLLAAVNQLLATP